jgi:S-(hydroxymethyl)glutathione dehydrogenase/alcohol dehydrogenase
VELDSSVGVFGLGAVGLAVVQAAKAAGASRIFAIDTNPDKFKAARELGATDFVNPSELKRPVQEELVAMTKWGIDYTYDCTGSVQVGRCWPQQA